MYLRGQIVKNPKQPQWGLGKILEVSGSSKVRVQFPDGKPPKLLDTSVVTLELIEEPSGLSDFTSGLDPLAALPSMDISKLRAACDLFISVMEDNRPNSDDAGVARRVINEIETGGRLTLTTFRRLAHWCHTDGSVYQRGVDLAHDISRAIYGRVISKDEI